MNNVDFTVSVQCALKTNFIYFILLIDNGSLVADSHMSLSLLLS